MEYGSAVSTEYAASGSFINPQGVSPTSLTYQMEVEVPRTDTVVVPFHNRGRYQDMRTTEISDDIGPVRLVENWPVRGDSESWFKNMRQVCGTLQVDVQADGLTVLSAADAAGQTVPVKN